MKTMRIMTMVAVLTLAATVARADRIALPKEPPVEKTLTGKLTWMTYKGADGTEQKAWLKLKTADGNEVTLLSAREVKNPAEYDKFVGKEVVATVMAQEAAGKKGKTVLFVKSIKDIKEAPPAKP